MAAGSLGLLLLALALAGTVLLEVSGTMPDSGAVTSVRPSLPPQAPVRPVLAGPGQVDAWAATVLARPLFNRDRRPVAAGAAPPAEVARLPRMTGVLVTPTLRRAIFAGPDGRSLVVPEGGRLGAFTVVAVRAGQAVVSGPDGERTVAPAFDPDAPAPAAAGAPTGPAGGGDLPGLPGFRLNGGAGGLPGLSPLPGLPPPAR